MAKHNAKRFDTKEYERNYKKSKNKKSKSGIFVTLIIIIISIIAITIIFNKKLINFNKETNNHESVSLSNIIPENTNTSPYSTKKFDNTDLSVSNLILKYENNITIISFSISNNSTKEQDVFNFTFSLLDENNHSMISYDLSSEEVIPTNGKKDFILIATRDVSNAVDFKIGIKK